MIDWIFDILEALFDGGEEIVSGIGDAVSEVDWSSVIDGVVSTGLIVAATITVAKITEDAIKNEIRNRQELKGKGVKSAVVQDFIQQSGYTEITLAALNSQNQQVGTFKMRAKSSSGIKKGDKICA